MYTRVESVGMDYKFDLLSKLHVHLPQNYPSIQKVQEVEINLLKTEDYPLLDLLVIDALVEVVIIYLGIDNQLHTLTEELTFMRTVEKPRDSYLQVKDFEKIGFKVQTDYHLNLVGNKRCRELEMVLLIRLFCQFNYLRALPWNAERKYHQAGRYSTRDNQLVRSKPNYPWKRLRYAEDRSSP